MKNILKIQELEQEIINLESSNKNSSDNKTYDKIKQNKSLVLENINNIEHNAGIIAKQFEQISQKYQQLNGKSEIIAKQKPEIMNVNNIGNLVEESNHLTSELAQLDLKMEALIRKCNELLTAYSKMSGEYKVLKDNQAMLKVKLDQQQADVEPKIASIKEQIKALEPKANKELYTKYKSMRADKIFPVYVQLRGNRCGNNRCGIELSLSFIENLKKSRMLPCENCRSIIIIDD